MFVVRWQVTRLDWEISGEIKALSAAGEEKIRLLLQGYSLMEGRSRNNLYVSISPSGVSSMVRVARYRKVVARNLGLWGVVYYLVVVRSCTRSGAEGCRIP